MIIQDISELTGAACQAMAGTPNERLRMVMDALVRHLHDFVREVRPSDEEWEKGLAFLAAIGQHTNDTHNEAILAADICR